MQDKIILFFDGECAFCNKTVQWILQNERLPVIQFCPLNSPYAQQNIPEELKKVDSVILYSQGSFYTHFDAFIHLIPYLKRKWKIGYLIVLLPRSVRNKLYKWIAQHRKRWFGTIQECWLLNSKWKNRLIN